MLFNVAALASFLAVASARIVGIALPETVAAGASVPITVEVQNYIQPVYDVAIVFGFESGDGSPDSLGPQVLGSYYIGPDQSNILTNFSHTVTIPSVSAGKALISASLTSLYGVLNEPVLTSFNVSVTVGQYTSTTLKSSSS
ncbi:hypothetical protein V8C35DRAFT_282111 [Trichoderma chlorosporum]